MSERKVWQAVLQGKCPQCRQGDLFPDPILKSPIKMSNECPECGLHYEREPGFFYGAMYVSYALSVAIFITTFVAVNILVKDPSLSTYIISVTAAALILYPVTFRYSRIFFIYLFGGVKYRPEKADSLK